jgi:hypothetical protein
VVVVLLVVSITIGAYHTSCLQSTVILRVISDRTNMDKYHPGYFGKVGMRHFHLTRNKLWRPTINVDKLWSLVPAEEKKDLSEDSEVVPVIDVLRHGYGKVLGNGRCVIYPVRGDTIRCSCENSLPKLPFILKTRFVSAKAESVARYFSLSTGC